MAATLHPGSRRQSQTRVHHSERSLYDPTIEFQGHNIYRTETPETVLTDYPCRPGPDISIICDTCKLFVPLPALKEHRQFHDALNILKYNEQPKSIDLLLKRRNAILRKIKSSASNENPVQPETIQRVNDAYEYLKSIVEGKFEELRQVREDVDAEVGGVGLNCSPDCVQSVGIAASANDRWKSYMEDARTFQDYFGEDKHKIFCGLYDGYHGRFAAEIAASELHRLLLNEMTKFDPRTKNIIAANMAGDVDISHYKFERPNTTQSERVILYDESVDIIQNIIKVCESKYDELITKQETPEQSAKRMEEEEGGGEEGDKAKKKKRPKSPFEKKMENAFFKAYYLLDILLSYGKDENSKIRWSGCSSATCVIQDHKEDIEEKSENTSSVSEVSGGYDPPRTIGRIHIANAGNVHGVLVRGNRAYGITKDHTPNNKKERNRVTKDGGNLSESQRDCRVNGVLQTTRGLGNHGDTSLKKCVIVEPNTNCIPIDQYAQFLILATRGVWEVFSAKEAASLLIKLLPNNQIPAPSKVNSTLNPLFDQIKEKIPIDPNSRRVSFSSTGTPTRGRSADLDRQARQRSGTLQSVDELSEKSSDGNKGEGHKRSKGKGSPSPVERQRDTINGGTLEKIEEQKMEGKDGAKSGSEKSVDNETSESPNKHSVQHSSTPTNSAGQRSSDKRSKNGKRYIDADMQTEVGSQYDEDDSDRESGNEGDIESYLEDISFPGSISRISMIDGPPSKEQMQRNQARYMAEYLVQAALLAGAKDNVTVMVVLFPGSEL